MKPKTDKIVCDTPVSRLLTIAVNESHKTQREITEESGFEKSNIITMLKQGRTGLAFERVYPLAETLNIPVDELMFAVLKTKYPLEWREIAHAIHTGVENGRLVD